MTPEIGKRKQSSRIEEPEYNCHNMDFFLVLILHFFFFSLYQKKKKVIKTHNSYHSCKGFWIYFLSFI